MLRLFSSIRQNLVNEGKTSRYVRYAVGEVLLIMVGILLALQVQTWNQNRMLEQERRELIKNLESDFQANLLSVKEGLLQAEQEIQIIKRFMVSIMTEGSSITEEDWFSFHEALISSLRYRPLLASYHAAVSGGSMNLLKDLSLHELLLEYVEKNHQFQTYVRLAYENYFLGEVPFLRHTVGSLPSIAPYLEVPKQKHFELSLSERKTWFKQKEIYACYENYLISKMGRQSELSRLHALNEQILTALEELN